MKKTANIQKQYQNQEAYSRRMTGANANRITVPMIKLGHISTASRVFKELGKQLEEIQDQKSSNWSKVAAAKYKLYEAHRALLSEANECYNSVHGIDFRGVR